MRVILDAGRRLRFWTCVVASAELTQLDGGRLPIMVVSHERSGTHFMMNAIAACFGYVSFPWLDIDRRQFNINYFHPQSLQMLILKIAESRPANILKSHHEFAFFGEIIASFKGAIDIVYIYRDPADVLASYWRFLHTWNWEEGPKADTALEFATAQPMGALMRLQFRQYDTMLDRWANHVERWADAASQFPTIHVVKYEDLAQHYDSTVKALGVSLGLAPRQILYPSRDENTVQQGTINYAPPRAADNRGAVKDLAAAKYPGLMKRLGYAA